MRMSGDRKVHATVPCDAVRKVRLMRHKNHRIVAAHQLGRYGQFQPRPLFQDILDAANPQPLPVALQRHILVSQHGDAMRRQGIRHNVRPNLRIVIAHHRIPQWGLQLLQQSRARIGMASSKALRKWSVAHEIAGQQDHIRLQ
jgi:hypothetical protein